MLRRFPRLVLAALALFPLATPEARAAAQRTFVASSGNDAAPCSITLPCRSFAAALAQTNAGGEIIVQDSAGYGAVTIGQSVSIAVPSGVYAGITATGDGVTINAPSIRVSLRGLTINASGRGVYIAAAASASVVEVNNLVILGSGSAGISQEADSRLHVTDTNASGMQQCYRASTTSGTAKMTVERSTAYNCYEGYFAGGNALLVIRESSAIGRGINFESYDGFIAEGSPAGPGVLECDRCLATNNGFGFVAFPYGGGSASSKIVVSNSVGLKNNGGVAAGGGATSVSLGNNRLYDNGPTYGNGSFSVTVTPY